MHPEGKKQIGDNVVEWVDQLIMTFKMQYSSLRNGEKLLILKIFAKLEIQPQKQLKVNLSFLRIPKTLSPFIPSLSQKAHNYCL